ncbi:TerB N-terminal domain-containing protein [Saccharospirillum impatiens]|uniref:TerB N-terminal domain-containing protein n=1 Tax=Saccharospirillum impatiens TaxID=169438 RepID=UPI0003FE4C24|nr:TerB N-terminal domain-containing protein [Saccharospirillum impatiens]
MDFIKRFVDLVGWFAALFIGLVVIIAIFAPENTEEVGPWFTAALVVYLIYLAWFTLSRLVYLFLGKPIYAPFYSVNKLKAKSAKSTTANQSKPSEGKQNRAEHAGGGRQQTTAKRSETQARFDDTQLGSYLKETGLESRRISASHRDTGDDSDFRMKATLKVPGRHDQSLTGDSGSTLNTTIKKQKRSGKEQFIMPNESVDVAGFPIHGPVYIGRAQPGARGVIDPDKKIKMSAPNPEPLGYWPDYCDLTPEQRGRYIGWLHEGRGYTDETGYPFLYFYGFERYVLLQANSDGSETRRERLMAIIEECERLSSRLGSRSFSNYSNDLVDYIIIKYLPELIEQRLQKPSAGNANVARYAISKFIAENPKEPLPGELAIHWYFVTKKLRPKDFVARDFNDFKQDFIHYYNNRGGVVVKKAVRKLKIVYGVAGASFNGPYSGPYTIETNYPDTFEYVNPNRKFNEILTATKINIVDPMI